MPKPNRQQRLNRPHQHEGEQPKRRRRRRNRIENPVQHGTHVPFMDALRMPTAISVNLAYNTIRSITNASGFFVYTVVSPFNWFDIEPAPLGGHQPIYYDWFSQVYTHYVAKSFHLDITCNNMSTKGLIAFVCPTNTGTPSFVSGSELLEQPYIKTVDLEPLGGRSMKRFRYTLPSERMLEMLGRWTSERLEPVEYLLSMRRPTNATSDSKTTPLLIIGAVHADLTTDISCNFSIKLSVQGEFQNVTTTYYSGQNRFQKPKPLKNMFFKEEPHMYNSQHDSFEPVVNQH